MKVTDLERKVKAAGRDLCRIGPENADREWREVVEARDWLRDNAPALAAKVVQLAKALGAAAPVIQALWDSTGVKRVEGGRYECLFNCHIDPRGMHSPSCPLVAIGIGMPKRIADALAALDKPEVVDTLAWEREGLLHPPYEDNEI